MLYRLVDRKQVQALVDARVEAHDAMMGERGEHLVQVVPVNTQQGTTPASLGLVMPPIPMTGILTAFAASHTSLTATG